MNHNCQVGIVSDSNSGLTHKDASRCGIEIISMPVVVNGIEYYEDETITREKFFHLLRSGASVSTAQPSQYSLFKTWDTMLRDYEEIVYIPMSAGLSGCVHSAHLLAEEFDGRVLVVDNHRISCTQKQSVFDAVYLARQGKSGTEIKEILEKHALEPTIYIAVDTLEHLKKGGRVTAAGAALAAVLDLKPILKISGDKLDAFGKARGMKLAQKKMLEAVKHDIKIRFPNQRVLIKGAYTCSEAEAEIWQKKISEAFPDHKVSLDPLSLSISCHIGEGASAIVCIPEIPETEGQTIEWI